MDKAMNTLPIQTYVRSRVQTVVTDVGSTSSGSVTLDLANPSDVTFVIMSDSYSGQPAIFLAAVGRQPTLLDFDVVMSPIDPLLVKNQSRVTLRLPAGSVTIYWKGIAADSTPQTFPAVCSRLVLAVDQ